MAENATIIGDVTVEKGASIWYGAVLRGDENHIAIGENSNVQDNATLHISAVNDLVLGKGVTVGHNAIVHGAKVGDSVLIGMGACVMDGAEIGDHCIIAAGALVTENSKIPAGSVCMGVPAKIVKTVTPEQIEHNHRLAQLYVDLAKEARE